MDLVTLSCMYLIVLFAFGSGIIFMGNEKIKARIKCPLKPKGFGNVRLLAPQKLDLVSQNQEMWTFFWKTLDALFWSLLGPGEEFKNKDDAGNSQDIISKQVRADQYQKPESQKERGGRWHPPFLFRNSL